MTEAVKPLTETEIGLIKRGVARSQVLYDNILYNHETSVPLACLYMDTAKAEITEAIINKDDVALAKALDTMMAWSLAISRHVEMTGTDEIWRHCSDAEDGSRKIFKGHENGHPLA